MKTTYTFEFKERGSDEWFSSNMDRDTFKEANQVAEDWKKEFPVDEVRIKKTKVRENLPLTNKDWIERKTIETSYKYL